MIEQINKSQILYLTSIQTVVQSYKPEANVYLLHGSDFSVKVEFAEGGKSKYPEKNLWSQIEIDKSQSTCEAWEWITGNRGGRCN